MKTSVMTGLAAFVVSSWASAAAPKPKVNRAASVVQRVQFTSGTSFLRIELLDDDLLHFEVSGVGPAPGPAAGAISTSPQVAKVDYAGPSSFSRAGNTLETAELRVAVDATTLCMSVTDKVRNTALTTLCPRDLAQPSQRLTLTPGVMQNAYGLGEQFGAPGQTDGDWVGRVRSPGDGFGNQMTGYMGGAAGNAQFPVLYAVGPGANFALFLDHLYRQTWSLNVDPWKIDTPGDQIRGYLMTGPDLPNLRQDFMELVGRPPVPPRKALGLWVSEYGYDDWAELEGKLAALRADEFPVDGFLLDLQWFGGVTKGSDGSNMGRVAWDGTHFPSAAAKLAGLRADAGIGVITIEESYVSKGLPEHGDLQARGFLVRACAGCDPVYLTGNPWWGKGGMIDWTQEAAGDYWHDLKRQPLISDGVLGHWIDLGEPEQYDPNDWVSGVLPGKNHHADYHNLYSFLWAQSIARGYSRNAVKRRPFLLARSGAAGIQRFGVALWSGDVPARLDTLAAHLNAQMHLSMSGVDYISSDVGGFHRESIDADLNELYTQWFADSLWVDIPVRPHTENLCNCKETAPDRVGSLASNRANTRQRYELLPYYYSLAHRAHLLGEPVVPPLVYYYQNDVAARRIGNEKLIGRDILVACIASPGATTTDVYLPAGDWVNYHTGQLFHSHGQLYAGQPLTIDGVFRIPAYVRAGAILPKMYVDGRTQNALGKRTDGTVRDELIARVYPAPTQSSFDLYEDDGETLDGAQGLVRTTRLSQRLVAASATVRVEAASGSYPGAPASRDTVVELVVPNQQATSVTLDGAPLTEAPTRASLDAAASGWLNAGPGLVIAKSGPKAVAVAKELVFSLKAIPQVSLQFVCEAGTTMPGQSVYAVGDASLLGAWQAQNAFKLEPNGPYPRWTGTLTGLPAETRVEWKCIKRLEAGDTSAVILWQPGPNNVVVTGATLTTTGTFTPSAPAQGVSAKFICENGTTTVGQSVYALGALPQLGGWEAQNAVKLAPDGPYPRWTLNLPGLPANARIEWKCIKRWEAGSTSTVLQWQPGPNSVLITPASGSAGSTTGSF